MPSKRISDGYAYFYHADTGKLLSQGRGIPAELAAKVLMLELPARSDPHSTRWDETTRSLVPYVNADRIADLTVERDRLNDEITRLENV